MDLSSFALTSADWQGFGGIFFVALIARLLHSEQRTLLMTVAGLLLVDSPATCYVVGVLAMVLKVIDFYKIGVD